MGRQANTNPPAAMPQQAGAMPQQNAIAMQEEAKKRMLLQAMMQNLSSNKEADKATGAGGTANMLAKGIQGYAQGQSMNKNVR